WGPLKIFHNDHGKLTPWDPAITLSANAAASKSQNPKSKIRNLSTLLGWWNSVATADLDGDGRLDIVAGNWGLNSPVHATATQRVRLYYGDLGGHGAVDLVEACFAPERGSVVPRRSLSALSQATPRLAEFFGTHRQFSTATVEDIFQKLQVRPGEVQATTLAS